MKAITLHQPWASLVALGVKTIETRSWATKYRGPLAIHAAQRLPVLEILDTRQDWTETAGVELRIPLSRFEPPRIHTVTHATHAEHAWHMTRTSLPLGAVVATCELVDCVPICPAADVVDDLDDVWPPEQRECWVRYPYGDTMDDVVVVGDGRPLECRPGQSPYGDFTPGRYAWLLADIKPIEPVPARGRQQLWEWADGVR